MTYPLKPRQTTNSLKPYRLYPFIMCHNKGFSPISIIGFGLRCVSSEIRVPNPPARITTFTNAHVLSSHKPTIYYDEPRRVTDLIRNIIPTLGPMTHKTCIAALHPSCYETRQHGQHLRPHVFPSQGHADICLQKAKRRACVVPHARKPAGP